MQFSIHVSVIISILIQYVKAHSSQLRITISTKSSRLLDILKQNDVEAECEFSLFSGSSLSKTSCWVKRKKIWRGYYECLHSENLFCLQNYFPSHQIVDLFFNLPYRSNWIFFFFLIFYFKNNFCKELNNGWNYILMSKYLIIMNTVQDYYLISELCLQK